MKKVKFVKNFELYDMRWTHGLSVSAHQMKLFWDLLTNFIAADFPDNQPSPASS